MSSFGNLVSYEVQHLAILAELVLTAKGCCALRSRPQRAPRRGFGTMHCSALHTTTWRNNFGSHFFAMTA